MYNENKDMKIANCKLHSMGIFSIFIEKRSDLKLYFCSDSIASYIQHSLECIACNYQHFEDSEIDLDYMNIFLFCFVPNFNRVQHVQQRAALYHSERQP